MLDETEHFVYQERGSPVVINLKAPYLNEQVYSEAPETTEPKDGRDYAAYIKATYQSANLHDVSFLEKKALVSALHSTTYKEIFQAFLNNKNNFSDVFEQIGNLYKSAHSKEEDL
jgi:hypothetical protein